MAFRYRVFKQHKSTTPVFTSPWYWLAKNYADSFGHDWKYCRIDDSKKQTILYETARSDSPIYELINYRVFLKDGTVLNVSAVNEQQAKNHVVYGKAVSFDDKYVTLDHKVHPSNIMRIEIS